MLESFPGLHHISLTPDKLLGPDEVVAIVDDDAFIREPLRAFLESHNLPVMEAVEKPPYPPSRVIEKVTFAPADTIIRKAVGRGR